MPPKAVYVHIPFCPNKCHYCDFTAYLVRGQPVDAYLDALEKEMERTVKETPPDVIHSIYIGGGTPTVLTPSQMERLLTAIRFYFPNWTENVEFTVEANPGTLQEPLLATMLKGGVNRISLGAQAFQSTLLQKIGRIHSVQEIERSVHLVRSLGFSNLSLDLMFGLPDQTVSDFYESLLAAVKLKPDHLSCYSLKIESGTRFHDQYEKGMLPLPTEDEEVEMYELARSFLSEAGYTQYEISNFAREAKQSQHNLVYWRNEDYYGFGAGAHGYVEGVRHENVKGIQEYIQMLQVGVLPRAHAFPVSRQEQMENFMILGLRLLEGVSRKRFFQLYQKELDEVFGVAIFDLQKKGLLISEGDRLRLTEKGILFGNEVFAAFL